MRLQIKLSQSNELKLARLLQRGRLGLDGLLTERRGAADREHGGGGRGSWSEKGVSGRCAFYVHFMVASSEVKLGPL